MFFRPSALRVRLDPDLRAFVDAQAKGMGVDRETWVRMVIAAMQKGRLPSLGVFAEGGPAAPESRAVARLPAVVPAAGFNGAAASPPAGPYPDPEDDSWRGPVEDDDDEDEAPAPARAALPMVRPRGPAAPPVEVFAREPQGPVTRPTTYAIYEPPKEFRHESILARAN